MFGYQLVTNRLRHRPRCSSLTARTLHGAPPSHRTPTGQR